ncbi:MAG: lipid-A-disaccharide synthase [Alphaproteobacteria bacterium]|nr:lipid-A-disaccharide synthase [Alphaproteobacteria bacterium]
MNRQLHIALIAGEPSGDALGAGLMAALKAKTNRRVRFSGVGGPLMEAQGLASLFAYDELAVMGFVEVVPKLGLIYWRMRQTRAALNASKPDALVTIDAPGFTVGVVKGLGKREFPRIHYVAPSVWAWRPKRVHKFKQHFDQLLALLPFEPPLFEEVGLACSFVGHPVLESGADAGDGQGFRSRRSIPADHLLVSILPGSRQGEVRRMLGPFGAAMALLKAKYADMDLVIPAMPAVEPMIRQAVKNWPVPARIVSAPDEGFDAMAASDVALAASGTVSLELALARVPAVIAYKLSPLTAIILRRLFQVDHVNLVNIILGKGAVPELLQQDATPERLAEEVDGLIASPERRQAVVGAQNEAIAKLRPPQNKASEGAADVVLKTIETWERQE